MKIFYQEKRPCSRKNHGVFRLKEEPRLTKGSVPVDVFGEEMTEKEVKLARNSG